MQLLRYLSVNFIYFAINYCIYVQLIICSQFKYYHVSSLQTQRGQCNCVFCYLAIIFGYVRGPQMGNCFTCLKEPSSTALESNSSHSKEEMPEGHLYPAPSHPLTSIPIETSILSNGNHITAVPEQPVTTPISRFCSYQRRSQSKSTPAMGITDSKSLDTKLNTLFDIYKDETEDAILAEGIEQLCKDLQVCPDEFKVLVLAWKLNAEQMCRFTRSEFVKGLKTMRADSIKGIQTRLPEIVNEVGNDPELFKDLYRFTFKFGLDSVIGQRILPSDMAVVLWRLVFTVREPPILNRWLNFLENRPVIRGIPRDTWNMFLNFSEAVGNDLSSYDDNEAWPSLFDDFVEYENDHTNQNISKDKECEAFLIKSNE